MLCFEHLKNLKNTKEGEYMEQKIKNIDYIKTVATLHDLDIEDRMYVAGLVKGLALRKDLKKNTAQKVN